MAMSAVKAYFNRNWRRQDMMSSAPIPQHARTALKRVYFTLFCAMSAAAFGSHLHLIWEAGGVFTVLSSVASLPWRVRNRFLILMVAAFCFGASVGPFTKYFFEIDQCVVIRVLQGLAIVFGCFWFAASVCRERSQIYIGVLIETWPLMRMWFNDTQWMLKVHVLLALFMVYLMLYSQEMLYDARFGDINAVNRTLTIFFHLPAVVVHAARCLCVRTQRRRGRINRRHIYIINRRLSR